MSQKVRTVSGLIVVLDCKDISGKIEGRIVIYGRFIDAKENNSPRVGAWNKEGKAVSIDGVIKEDGTLGIYNIENFSKNILESIPSFEEEEI